MDNHSPLERRNLFLRNLPTDTRRKIENCLESVAMPLGMEIYQPYEDIKYVYFPETSIISVVTQLQNGSGVETGIVGKEGFSGIEIVLGENCSPREAMVQLGGVGFRMKTEAFRTFFGGDQKFSALVLRYLYAFITQIGQNSVCLCYHPIKNRLARWLLMFHERAATDELKLTQEFIALMLGVHRPSLSKHTGELQNKKLISYNRGLISILDREGLKNAACECYDTIKHDFDKYLQNAKI